MRCSVLLLLALCARTAPGRDDHIATAQKAAAALSAHDYAGAAGLYREALMLDAARPEYHDGLGMALGGLGQLQAAIDSLQRAISIEERPAFAYHLGLLLVQSRDRRKAIRAFESSIRLNRDAWEAKYALSEQCLHVGDSEGAILLLQQVVHERPNLGAARLDLALTWMQLERNDQESIRQLLVAMAIEPNSPAPHLALGELYAARNDHERAIRELRRAVELDAADPEAHYNLALVWRLDGKLDEAEAELRRALELKPRHGLAHKALGLVLRERNNLAGARDEFLKSVEADPRDAEAHHLLGSVLLRLGDAESAASQFLTAASLNPVLVEAYSNLAAAYAKLGRTEEAARARAQAESSRDLKARASRSIVLLQEANQKRSEGDKSGAISSLRRAVALSPDFGEATFQLATLLSGEAGSFAEAERLFRRVVEINPRYARAYRGLGSLLLRSKRYSEGESALQHALELAPSLADAHAELGKLATVRKHFLDAVSEYGSVLAWQPDNVEARVQRGRALAEVGQYKTAEQELQTSIREKALPEAYHYLGVTLRAMGRHSEAAVAFRTAQQLKYNNGAY